MTMKENDKPGGGKIHFSDFPPQTIILGLLTAVVMGIYVLARPFWNAYWLPIIIAAIGLISLVLLSFWRGLWRNYRWIVGSTILILLVLINVSWAKSNLGINALEKRQLFQCSIPSSNSILHVEYPPQILYNSQNIPSLSFILWAETADPSSSPSVKINANGFLLGSQISKDSPIQWGKIIETGLPVNGNALTILFLPVSHNLETTIEATFNIENTCANPEKITIILEGKQDAQHRMWATAFLDTGGIIVSLALGVFAALKQLEEEKKRQKVKQVEQRIASFDSDLTYDFSDTLNKHLELTSDWNEWDKAVQDQFRKLYSSSFEEKLWERLLAKTTSEIINDVDFCLQVCMKIFNSEKEKPIPALQQLQSALKRDGQALLSLVRDYPSSAMIAKRIAKNYPTETKTLIMKEWGRDFKDEIKLLARELDFPSDYPLLESLFWRYGAPNQEDRKLKEWLNLHKLSLSPFVDTNTPFTSIPENNENFLVDLTPTGFSFDLPSQKEAYFKFNDPWDLRTAVYSFCKTLPNAVASQSFLALFPPSLLIEFEKESAINLVLHALGEQWLNTIADEPTIFYDLDFHQQKVLARILCWHYGSAHSILARLFNEIDNKYALILNEGQQIDQRVRNKEKKVREFMKKASNWLDGATSAPLHAEEIPHLLDLRPSSTHRTFLLIPSIDLKFRSEISIDPDKYDAVDMIVDRLNIHNYTFIHFYLTDRNWWDIDDEVLKRVINNRIRYCAMQSAEPSEQINTLNDLFIRHDKDEPVEKILARKAFGSPGRMVRLGQKLLLQHVEKYSPDDEDNYKYLHIEDLEAL